jgi:hypothetical protein
LDKIISIEPLQGEGKWVIETVYQEESGATYTIWSDQDGDEWYIEKMDTEPGDVLG